MYEEILIIYNSYLDDLLWLLNVGGFRINFVVKYFEAKFLDEIPD